MGKLISYREVEQITGLNKSTITGYRKKPSLIDGDPIFPEPVKKRTGVGYGQGLFFDIDEVKEGAKRIKRNRELIRLKKIERATAKNNADKRERKSVLPSNYKLAFRLMNQCVRV